MLLNKKNIFYIFLYILLKYLFSFLFEINSGLLKLNYNHNGDWGLGIL